MRGWFFVWSFGIVCWLSAVPASASQTGVVLTFGEWAAVCDNGWRCEALLANSNSGPSIHIVREGGGEGETKLSFYLGASASDTKGFVPERFQTSGGRSDLDKPFPAPIRQDGNEVVFEGRVAESLLQLLFDGDSLKLFGTQGRSATVSTHGLLAVLVYFDTVQLRIGDDSALAARGPEKRTPVSRSPSLPFVKIPPISNKPPRVLTKAQAAKARLTFPCSNNAAPVGSAEAVEHFRLDERTTLALVTPPCSLSAYNGFKRILLIDEEGGIRLAPIEGDGLEVPKAENLVGGRWDKENRRLVSFGRWNGLCGSGESYAWDGEMFRIVEEQATASCDLEIYSLFTTWRATTRTVADGR
jgi:hypothetical protein